jgi:hypothetical protein
MRQPGAPVNFRTGAYPPRSGSGSRAYVVQLKLVESHRRLQMRTSGLRGKSSARCSLMLILAAVSEGAALGAGPPAGLENCRSRSLDLRR